MRNNEEIQNKSYLSTQWLHGGKKFQNLIGRDGKMNFLEERSMMKSNSLEYDLTSVDRKVTGLNNDECTFRVTGLLDGNDCEKYLSVNGNQDVAPTTYPAGHPKKYFESLNKNNVES